MKTHAKISYLSGFVLLALLTCLAGCAQHESPTTSDSKAAQRPNILWLVIDDMGLEFSCYGEELIETPNIDRLAREGTRFTNAFLTSPVCSTARSAMITGMYQTTIGRMFPGLNNRIT